jgi:hypothetical protein
MAKSREIRVTPNVTRCVSILKKAVAAMPDGDLKRRAKDALAYLEDTFAGKPQPLRGAGCPIDTGIIR